MLLNCCTKINKGKIGALNKKKLDGFITMVNDNCPNCNQRLIYNHYIDSLECLFCNYKQRISKHYPLSDDYKYKEDEYSYDDSIQYGEYSDD